MRMTSRQYAAVRHAKTRFAMEQESIALERAARKAVTLLGLCADCGVDRLAGEAHAPVCEVLQ